MKKDFSPRKKILILVKYWWVITILAIAGGIFAFFVSKFRQPIYDAKATISAGIDYSQTGQMSEADQDRAYQAVGSIIVSDEVREKVIQEAGNSGILIDHEDFSNLFFLERYNSNFNLRVESYSPENAAILANIWANVSQEVLNYLILQVNHQSQIKAILTEIESCYSYLGGFDSQAITCQLSNSFKPTDIVNPLEYVLEENVDSGLFPAFYISITNFAEASAVPRINNRNFLISAGALVGFLMGILIIESGLLFKWIKPNAKIKRDI